MNEYFTDPSHRGGFDAMYYWDQFHPILAAIVILLLGWIIALIVAAGVKKLLQKLNTNHRLSSATGHKPNIENLLSKLVFWFVIILAVVGALNVLNISGVSDPFSNMVSRVLAFIPNLLAAVAVGFIGWILAGLVKAGLTNVLARTEMDEKLSNEVGVGSLSSNIGEIFYWLVLLLFLPIVLSILGLTGLLIPVQNMVNEAVAYLLNLFIAGVIIFVGYILAKIVRGIVEGLSNSLGLQTQAEKIGLFKNSNVSKFLGSFVFAIIIITALIVAFEALGIEAISQPATAMLNQIMYAIPQIIAAGLILIVAYVVSRFVGRLVAELVSGAGVDEIPMKLDVQRFLGQTRVSGIIGCLIGFFTMLFAVSEAADRLGLEQVSVLIAMFIQFGASILLGAVILVVGFWLANVVANVIQRGEYNSSRWLGNLVRILIMGLVIAMGLRALGIADSIVNLAFGLTLGAVAVAFALSFDLGGQEAASRFLRKMQDKMDKERDEAKAKSALQPSKSTQEKVQESVRDNTPTTSTSTITPSAAATELRMDTVNTSTLNTNTVDINNTANNEILPSSGLIDDTDK